MSAFIKRKKLGKPVSVNYKKKRAAKKNNTNEIARGAAKAGMQKVNECYPSLNIGDIMRFSIEGKKSNKDFSKEKKEILRIFNDAANDYCLKYKKKPRFR